LRTFYLHKIIRVVPSVLLILFCASKVDSQTPRTDPVGTEYPARQTPVHDPAVIKHQDTWYIFSTGFGISVYSSKDLKIWKKEKSVFDTPPKWAIETIKGYRGHTWAPDISYVNGLYYLYYSISAFGKNTSAIGLAVNKTLDPMDKDFAWRDLGMVVQSIPGRDMWNAIDPNLVIDKQGRGWLSFGSFWNGMKMFKLNDDLSAPAQSSEWFTIASRPRSYGLPDSIAGDAAIEAPFIFQKEDWYYLIVSWDYCCRGEKSTYKLVIGRSKNVYGPYFDKEGKPLNENGGSLLLEGDKKEWYGIGHCSVYRANGKDFLFAHGYDALDKGKAKLIIRELIWDNQGWPLIEM
jgi:arabinan endo-1,5-alpha-L-arabinosidase